MINTSWSQGQEYCKTPSMKMLLHCMSLATRCLRYQLQCWIYAATMAYPLTLTTPHSITLHHPIPHHTTTLHATPHHTQALELMDTTEDVPQVSVLGSALSFQCLPVCVSSYQYFSADTSASQQISVLHVVSDILMYSCPLLNEAGKLKE